MKDIRYILHFAFSNTPKTLIQVINYGTLKGERLTYNTANHGKQIKTISEINQGCGIKVLSFEDINLHESLFYWFKDNQDHRNKRIRIDYDLLNGEIYTQRNWSVLKLLIKTDEDSVFVKPILN